MKNNDLSYFMDKERVLRVIWSTINVKGKVILDFGIGESTEILVKLGAKVIGVDNDIEKSLNILASAFPLLSAIF